MKVRAACILTFRIFPPVNPRDVIRGSLRVRLVPEADVIQVSDRYFRDSLSPHGWLNIR